MDVRGLKFSVRGTSRCRMMKYRSRTCVTDLSYRLAGFILVTFCFHHTGAETAGLQDVFPLNWKPPTGVTYECPQGWDAYGRWCFKVFNHDMVDTEARAVCKSEGGQLAKIEDITMNVFVGNLVNSTNSTIEKYYIGLHRTGLDPTQNMSAYWMDGSSPGLGVGHWDVDQPDITKGSCTVVRLDSINQYPWSIQHCFQALPFVCSAPACLSDEFLCANSRCINRAFLCDSDNDCGDMSDESNCTDSKFIEDVSGEFMTTNYPNSYDANKVSLWTVKGPVGTRVKMEFTDFETESDLDVVDVWVGGRTFDTSQHVATLSGKLANSQPILSTSHWLIVRFSTDRTKQLKGFKVKWTTVNIADIGGPSELVVSSEPRFLASPNYPQRYMSNFKYSWTLRSRRWTVITVEMLDVDLALGDSVTVFDGDDLTGSPLAVYTLDGGQGGQAYRAVTTTGPAALVHIASTSINPGSRGFRISYKVGCEQELNGTSGVVQSPGYGVNNYPNLVTCTWRIRAQQGRSLKLIFPEDKRFALENSTDVLQIYVGSDSSGLRLHNHTSRPSAIISPSGQFFVQFTATAINNDVGFYAEYSYGCMQPNFTEATLLDGAKLNASDVAVNFGDSFNVSCEEGYYFSSEAFNPCSGPMVENVTLSCMKGGEWNLKTIPQCKRRYCGPAPNITNGYITVTSSVLYQGQAFYKCYDGFQLSTASPVLCQSNGTWSTPPTCSARGCPRPAPIPQGAVNFTNGDGTTVGTIADFSCNHGYVLSGIPRVLCQLDGNWSASITPTCEPVKCLIPDLKNAMTAAGQLVTLNTTLNLTCHTGYEQNYTQPALSICRGDRLFDNNPRCVDVDECKTANGGCQHHCNNTEGSFVCSCRDGYVLNADGATCRDVDECSTMNGWCDQVCVNTVAGYRCECNKTGYHLLTVPGMNSIYPRPSESGYLPWHVVAVNHTCVRAQCPNLPDTVANGKVLRSGNKTFHFDDTVDVLCNLGYVLSADGSGNDFNRTLTCLATGTWDTALPNCTVARCPPLQVPTNLKNPPVLTPGNSTVEYLQKVELNCTVPGRGNFSRQRQCVFDITTQQYAILGDELECGVIDCGTVGNVHGMKASIVPNNTLYGSTFAFECEKNFTRYGNSSYYDQFVRCTANGTWDLGGLRCIGPVCEDPGRPPDGQQIVTSYESGETLQVTCLRPGFAPNDTTALTCTYQQGTLGWDRPVPMCVDAEKPVFVDCPTEVLVVDLLDVLRYDRPNITDNTAAKSLTSSYNLKRPFEGPRNVTWTAEDFYGNTATCVVAVRVRDTMPPTINCTGPRDVYIENPNSVVTVDVATDNPMVATDTYPGMRSATYQPTTLRVTYDDIHTTKTVTYTAEDLDGNSAVCVFQYTVRPRKCRDWNLPQPTNGVKNCTTITSPTSGLRCEMTCNTGYVFYKVSTSLIYTCNEGQDWLPSLYVPECTAVAHSVFVHELAVTYSCPSPIHGACFTVYQDVLNTNLAGLGTDLSSQCRGSMAVTAPTLTARNATINSNTTNQFNVTFTLTYGPPTLPDNNMQTCVGVVELAFKVNVLLGARKVHELTSGGCETVTMSFKSTLSTQRTCSSGFLLQIVGDTTKCVPCPPGQYNNNGMGCVVCPYGTYQDAEGALSCLSCPNNTYTYFEASTNASNCKPNCAPGLVSSTRLPPCRPCPVDTYWANSTSCLPCPTDTTTLGLPENATIAACKNKCPAGSFSSTGYEPCTPCPRGFYQSLTGQTNCTSCLVATQTTANVSSAASTDCTNSAPTVCPANYCNSTNGQCVISDNIIMCLCNPGYTGDRCETDIDDCASSPCYYNGTCVDGTNNYTCNCRNSYSGQRCEVETQHCASKPCLNGGMCQDLDQGYKCLCRKTDTFSGPRCENRTDICTVNPCRNGATCLEVSVIRRSCACRPGFTGVDCENTIDECASSPCLYSGACQDLENDYNCSCPTGFTGKRCQVRPPAVCGTGADRCGQAGRCVDDYRSSTAFCVCSPGFTSDEYWTPWLNADSPESGDGDTESITNHRAKYGVTLCQGRAPKDVQCRLSRTKKAYGTAGQVFDSACTVNHGLLCYNTNQTTNNNTCHDYEVRYLCDVKTVGGTTCIAEYGCSEDHCQNDATCGGSPSAYTCTCKPGYEGHDCQHDKDNCEPDPCQNEARCTDLVNDYTCACRPGYDGKNCERDIDECTPSPCEAQGTARCDDLVGDYFCHCKDGYTGRNCSIDIDECASQPCLNGGNCSQTVADFNCQCAAGWQGKQCENLTATCTPQVCQNGGVCYNIFNDYFCACTPQTFGRNCMRAPDMCNQSNPCQNGAVCKDEGGMAGCACPTGYSGPGCQCEVDICKNNPCKNEGECKVLGLGRYECKCQDGYAGVNCETNIDDCTAVQCQAPSQCVDGVNVAFCDCPINKDGHTCDKDVDDNFDLVFDAKGTSRLLYPFVLNLTSLTLSVSVQFKEPGSNGTFLCLYVSPTRTSDELEKGLLCLSHSKLRLEFLNMAGGQEIELSKIPVNDGAWHTLTITWDSASGGLIVRIDANLQLGSLANIYRGDTLPEFGNIVLGGDKENNDLFRGSLTQVRVWDRVLTTQIPSLFSPTPPKITQGLVLPWARYRLRGVGNVRRVLGTKMCINSCPPSPANKVGPKLVGACPSPILQAMAADKRVTQISWTKPTFSGATTELSNYRSGAAFGRGIYPISYMAQDVNKNVVKCDFNIYVRAGQCELPAAPLGGDPPVTVSNTTLFDAIEVTCPAGKALIRQVPRLFTCGPLGSYNKRHPMMELVLPPCGNLGTPKRTLEFGWEFRTVGTLASSTATFMERQLLEKLRAWNTFLVNAGKGVCATSPCSEAVVMVTASGQWSGGNDVSAVNISMTGVPVSVGTSVPLEAATTQAVLQDMRFMLNDVLGAKTIDPLTFYITSKPYCDDGFQAVGGQCVECTQGMFYDVTQRTCSFCPLGTFQNQTGQSSCVSCGPNSTTPVIGAIKASMCIELCKPGAAFNATSNVCVPCERGFYQPEAGATICRPCANGKTTLNTSSTSESDCQAECESGYQLMGSETCIICPVGTYRTKGEQLMCENCPGNLTSSLPGARNISDCDLVSCTDGNVRVGRNPGSCEKCPLGTYRSGAAVNCSVCGHPYLYRTDAPGAVTKTQCKRYCGAGRYLSGSPPNQTCEPCPLNTYKALDDLGSYYITQCTPCPARRPRTSATNATSLDECKYGNCTAGEIVNPLFVVNPNGTAPQCLPCGYGYYQPNPAPLNDTCLSCPQNTSTLSQRATAPTDCTPICPDGEETVGTNCTKCARGFYKNNTASPTAPFESCRPCDPAWITPREGAVGEDQCTFGNCSAGSFWSGQGGSCTLCPNGTYQDERWQVSCKTCPPEYTTAESGAAMRAECSVTPNRTRIAVKFTMDKPWDPAYSDRTSTEFKDIKTSVGADMNTKLKDVPGFKNAEVMYLEEGSVIIHTELMLDKGSLNQTTLDASLQAMIQGRTLGGNAVQTTFQAAPKPDGVVCTKGFKFDYDTSGCTPCSIGYYQKVGDDFVCRKCAQFYTTASNASVGEDKCKRLCVAGTQSTGGKPCDPCPKGTYKLKDGVDMCTACPPEQTTKLTGALSQDKCYASCPVGQRAPPENQTTCILCEKDTYNDLTAQVECKKCPKLYRTKTNGSTKATDCLSVCEVDPAFCLNGARCRWDAVTKLASCRCTPMFKGERCETRKPPTSDMSMIVGLVIGIVGANLLILLIVLGVCVSVRNKKKEKTMLDENRVQDAALQVMYQPGLRPGPKDPLYDNTLPIPPGQLFAQQPVIQPAHHTGAPSYYPMGIMYPSKPLVYGGGSQSSGPRQDTRSYMFYEDKDDDFGSVSQVALAGQRNYTKPAYSRFNSSGRRGGGSAAFFQRS